MGETITPYYGRKIKDVSTVSDYATTASISEYANWWIGENIREGDIDSISAFNASNVYMISIDPNKSCDLQYYENLTYNGLEVENRLHIYPDVYLSSEYYDGGLGYAITHLIYDGQTQRIIKNQRDISRQ
jgi:hypothetical protein